MTIAVGDWVTERNTKAAIAPNPWSPSYERVKQLIKGPRKGRVVALNWKQSAKGRKTLYAEVLWTGSRTASTHGAMRLMRIPEADPNASE